MIRQVTAGFLVAASKTRLQAALGQEAGQGDTGHCRQRRFKASLPAPVGEAGQSRRILQPGKGLGAGPTSASPHAAPQTRMMTYPLCLGQGKAIQGCPRPTGWHARLRQPS